MTALITGATSGIGKASAELFAKNSWNLIITGRRKDHLEAVAADLQKKYKIKTICLNFDVRNLKEVVKNIDSIKGEWKNIDLLLNNAGLASGLSTIQEGNIEDWEVMIDTNIKGLLYMTRYIAPMLIEKNKGHIINVASLAGKQVYPNGNVYCATKFAVDALSKAMRMDMIQHGIRVTNIAPGLVETEFSMVRFKGDAERAKKTYENIKALSAEDIAEIIYWAASRPAHVNINDIVITPTAQANAYIVNRNTK
ncbi:MAG: SDR family NAD(P)-dependent oxidoreductase [Bacteroidetes bacterium]|nr:MAG: SDR family NAD(P)-dependent oxidoreductase [Bacteroidota bacterium]